MRKPAKVDPKFEVGDKLISGGYSFTVGEIEEDLETKMPVYVEKTLSDKVPDCFCEGECKRTRKAKKNV